MNQKAKQVRIVFVLLRGAGNILARTVENAGSDPIRTCGLIFLNSFNPQDGSKATKAPRVQH